ncbi:hypothetical protein [Saccharopolyspora phatthalungensis]|uniref:Uncharacterized protein n=1 Tax=Saccharopolyspora phatthalungensis TaxID=664693 RepID=A0A840Q372_9PSEU|nr:hypothetical protein [Saccharopolyspora phatthalungensis]MBB5154944.1 hypothetical protein [Saccharopolyspora phatthalungensis]
MTEPESPTDEPPAATAGEESHEDAWQLAGEEADAPEDTGRSADEEGES